MMKIYLFQSVLIPLTNSVKTSYSLPEDEICTFQLNKDDFFNKIIAHKQLFAWQLKEGDESGRTACLYRFEF